MGRSGPVKMPVIFKPYNKINSFKRTSYGLALKLIVFFKAAFTLHSQQVVVTTNADLHYAQFKEFLSAARPPIANVELARSSFFYANKGKPLTHDVEYVASIQPDTFYVKQIGVLYELDTNKYTVSGFSYLDKWYINEYGQVTIISRDSKVSGTNTPQEKTISEKLSTVEDVLNFGIFLIDRQSVSWVNDNFRAQTTMPTEFGYVSGRIFGSNVLMPSCLEYKFSNRKNTSYKVVYEYNDDGKRPAWVPYKTILSITSPEFSASANSLLITNTIERLVVGLTNVGVSGYVYQGFLPNGVVLSNGNFVVYSNGIGYALVGKNYQKVEAPTATVLGNPTRLKAVRIFFFIFILVNIIGFGWYVTRCRSKNPK
jgi:hypothetical protein